MKQFRALLVAITASIACSIIAAPAAVAAPPTGQPPVVTLVTPPPGTSYSQNEEILLYARATDPDGKITKVEFYDGSTLLGTDTGGLYLFAIPPRTASLGAHTFTARAYDDQGLTTTSKDVTVSVVPPVKVQIPGYIHAGVEFGCMLLVPESSDLSPGPYLLLGGDKSTIVPGAHLLVTGEVMTRIATFCMQGTPLAVWSAEPL